MDNSKLIVLGPEGTNGHNAAKILLDKDWVPNWKVPTIKFVPSNVDILNAVNGAWPEAFGLVPIENGSGGLVAEVIHYWMGIENKLNANKNVLSPRLRVIGEISIPVEHFLLVHPSVKKVSDLEVICSHPQALLQCRKNIARIKFSEKTRATLSTADAAFKASVNPHVGALASLFAGGINKLKPLRRMHDFIGNATRFHIIAKVEPKKALTLQHGRTAVILWLKNKPGAFASVADIFRENDINMSSLHAIPLGKLSSYAFYCEFDEYMGMDLRYTLFSELKRCCKKLLVLGSYEREVK